MIADAEISDSDLLDEDAHLPLQIADRYHRVLMLVVLNIIAEQLVQMKTAIMIILRQHTAYHLT